MVALFSPQWALIPLVVVRASHDGIASDSYSKGERDPLFSFAGLVENQTANVLPVHNAKPWAKRHAIVRVFIRKQYCNRRTRNIAAESASVAGLTVSWLFNLDEIHTR